MPLDDAADRDAVTALSFACADYALIVTGAAPTDDAGAAFFRDLPPGRTRGSILKRGVREASGRLIALLDVVPDYPEPAIWYLGLLLIHPDHRRAGLGRALVDGLADHARSRAASRLRLGVVAANEPALRFWPAMGFIESRRTEGHRIGALEHLVIEFDRAL